MRKPARIVIIGATSGIAEATARIFATEKAALVLVGRNGVRLEELAADLRVRGGDVSVAALDPVTADPAAALAGFAIGGIDVILLAYGTMPDQAGLEREPAAAAAVISVNYVSAAGWALAAANLLERQGFGTLIVLGSPAGDRGRRKNYIYGSTKAGIATLVQGISHRFAGRGPRAILLKPGPTATAMTADLTAAGARLASPHTIARDIRRAVEHGGPIQYSPRRWALIMAVVRAIPSKIFDRLNF